MSLPTSPSRSRASNLLQRGTWGSEVGREGVACGTELGLASSPSVFLVFSLCLTGWGLHWPLGGIPPVLFSLAQQGVTPPGNLLHTLHDAHQSLYLFLEVSHYGEQTFPLRTGNLPDALPQQRQALAAARGLNFQVSGRPSIWVVTNFFGVISMPSGHW